MRHLAARRARPPFRCLAARGRLGALLAAALAIAVAGPAGAADAPAGAGLLGGLLPLSATDLAGLASGGPMVLGGIDTAGGGVASNSVTTAPDGSISIRSSASASASIAGAPVTLDSGGQLLTGGFDGDLELANGGGIATTQFSSGLNNIQQGAVSFAFVVSGLPQ